jgi:hypothetical protein
MVLSSTARLDRPRETRNTSRNEALWQDSMPTLIRLIIVLAILAGLVFGGMLALVAMVEPTEKDVVIRIPSRELMPSPERDPLVRREIDTSRPAATPEAEPAPAEPEPAEPAAEPAAESDSVQTLAPGVE